MKRPQNVGTKFFHAVPIQKLKIITYYFLLLLAEMSFSKLTLRKMDKNIESFLETELMTKQSVNTCTTVQILDEFSLNNLENLKKMERKLKNDETFYSALVN